MSKWAHRAIKKLKNLNSKFRPQDRSLSINFTTKGAAGHPFLWLKWNLLHRRLRRGENCCLVKCTSLHLEQRKNKMRVMLAVYDLSRGLAAAMSQAILGEQLEGIWHTGVVVFSKEYLLPLPWLLPSWGYRDYDCIGIWLFVGIKTISLLLMLQALWRF